MVLAFMDGTCSWTRMAARARSAYVRRCGCVAACRGGCISKCARLQQSLQQHDWLPAPPPVLTAGGILLLLLLLHALKCC